MPSVSQGLPKTRAKTSRAWCVRSWRLHQAKLAAARIAPRYAWPSGLRTGAQASCESGSSKPYLFGASLNDAEVVVADLVAQPARAGVDQDRDLPLAQAHHLGRRLVEDAIDDLDFEEVVARAERAALVVAARDRRGR